MMVVTDGGGCDDSSRCWCYLLWWLYVFVWQFSACWNSQQLTVLNFVRVNSCRFMRVIEHYMEDDGSRCSITFSSLLQWFAEWVTLNPSGNARPLGWQRSVSPLKIICIGKKRPELVTVDILIQVLTSWNFSLEIGFVLHVAHQDFVPFFVL